MSDQDKDLDLGKEGVSSEEEDELNNTTEEPTAEKPLWEKRGFSSLEEMVASMDGDLAGAKLMQSKAEEILNQQVIGSPPVLDADKLEEEGEAYLQKYHQQMQEFYAKQNQPKAQAAMLDAVTEGVLASAATLGYDRDLMYGTMRSIAMGSPEKQALAKTVDGIRLIGREALDKMEKLMGKKKDETPPSHKSPKGGKPSAPAQNKPKKSEVEELEDKIKEAGNAGNIDEVINLTLKKQAARLKK